MTGVKEEYNALVTTARDYSTYQKECDTILVTYLALFEKSDFLLQLLATHQSLLFRLSYGNSVLVLNQALLFTAQLENQIKITSKEIHQLREQFTVLRQLMLDQEYELTNTLQSLYRITGLSPLEAEAETRRIIQSVSTRGFNPEQFKRELYTINDETVQRKIWIDELSEYCKAKKKPSNFLLFRKSRLANQHATVMWAQDAILRLHDPYQTSLSIAKNHNVVRNSLASEYSLFTTHSNRGIRSKPIRELLGALTNSMV